MAAQLTDIWQARLFGAHTLEPVEDRQEAELARRLPLCRQPEANETVVAQRLPDDLAREDILGAVHTAKRCLPGGLEAACREQADLVVRGLAQLRRVSAAASAP